MQTNSHGAPFEWRIFIWKRSKRKSNKAIAIINQAEKEKKNKKMKSKVPTNLIEKEEKKNKNKKL